MYLVNSGLNFLFDFWTFSNLVKIFIFILVFQILQVLSYMCAVAFLQKKMLLQVET
jgi:hypothetical protein